MDDIYMRINQRPIVFFVALPDLLSSAGCL